MTDKRNENASRRLTDKEIEETLLGLEKAEKNLSSLKGDEIKEKFSKVFAHSPHPFPEGTSLEDKVKYISEGTKQVQAIREKNLIQKMENISKLSQELESKKKLFKEEGRKNLEKINKRLEENGYVPMNNVEGKSSKELSTKASLREDAHTHTASPISSKENAAQTHLKNNLEPALNYLRDTVDDKNNFLKDNRTLKNGSYKPDEKPKEGNIKKENKNRFSDLINNFCKKVLENLQIDGTSKQKENKNTTLPGNLIRMGSTALAFVALGPIGGIIMGAMTSVDYMSKGKFSEAGKEFFSGLKNVSENLFKGIESMTEKNLSLKGTQDLDKEQVIKTPIGLEGSTKHRDKVLEERERKTEQNRQLQI